MAWFVLARVLLVAAISWVAGLVQPFPQGVGVNVGFGALVGILIVFAEIRLRSVSIKAVLGAVVGGTFGLLVARALGSALLWTSVLGPAHGGPAATFLNAALVLAFIYTGAAIGVRYADWLHPTRLMALFQASSPQRRYKVLDTGVIIDGRVAAPPRRRSW